MWSDWPAVLASAILDGSVRALVVAVAAGCFLAVLRIRSSSIRHAAWRVVLAAMLVMPLLTQLVPAAGAPLPRTLAPSWSPPAPGRQAPGGGPLAIPGSGAQPVRTSLPPAVVPADDMPLSLAVPSRTSVSWPLGALIAWAAVASLLLARLPFGWLAMRRVVRSSRSIDGGIDGPWRVRESPVVAVPLSTGIVAPSILLPAAWRSWPRDTLCAVMAHESAHLRRRDPLVMLLARVNRSVFWFHPLAWWLERTLAATAEDACDETAAREVATPHRYAEVLLAMADAVRRAGARVAWQGVPIDGGGFLERRIDRVLRGVLPEEVSAVRRLVLFAGCAGAIVIVAACRQPATEQIAALRPDGGVAENIERTREREDWYKTAVNMSTRQARELEALLQASPENVDARRRLGVFYRVSGPTIVGWNETVAARRRHILWLIEHHPGSRSLLDWGPIYPAHDAEGYALATRAWRAQVDKAPDDVEVLGNAAYFFEVADKPLAEKLVRMAKHVDPGGPTPPMVDGIYFPSWSSRLAAIYAGALLGITEGSIRSGDPTMSVEAAHGLYADEVRRKLAHTTDVALLTEVARELVSVGRAARGKLDYDAVALAQSYLARARQLDPQEARVKQLLAAARMNERHQRAELLLQVVPRNAQVSTVLALSPSDRFDLLPWLAELRCSLADYYEWTRRDPAAARSAREASRKYAEDLLAIAAGSARDPRYGIAVFAGHVTLASLALQEGNTRGAIDHARQAADAAPSEELEYYNSMLWQAVAAGLLKRGERDTAAQLLDSYARLCQTNRKQAAEGAAAIRAGVMPDFYQYLVTRSGGTRP